MPDERKFSELTTAATLTNDDILALSQIQSGALTSVKSTLYAIAVHITKLAQYTSDLQTTDKTIIGAINELKRQIALIPGFNIVKVNSLPTEDIDTHTLYLVPSQDPEAQNSCDEYINTDGTTAGWELVGSTNIDLSDYYTKLEVDGLLADKLEADDFEASQTASANPITLETKQAGLAKSCVVEMNPIQDLHGYDHPWAGGAGKNKLQNTASSSGNFTVNSDGTVTVNGSFSGTSQFTVGTFDFKANTQYKLVGCPTGGGGSSYALYARGVEGFDQRVDQGSGVTFTPTQDVTTEIRIIIYSGYTASNVLFKPMISTDTSVTYATFAPYENICPISGRTEASVTRTGKNKAPINDFTVTRGTVETFSPNLPSGTYSISFNATRTGSDSRASSCRLIYDDDTNYEFSFSPSGSVKKENITATKPIKSLYMYSIGGSYSDSGNFTLTISNFQIEEGSTATEYEPYQTPETHTKEFGQTVYGGSLDFVNGSLDNEYELFEPTTVTTVAQSSGLWYWAFSLPKTSTNPLSTNGLMSSHFNPTNQVLAIGNCYITANGTLLLCVPSDQTLNSGALVNAWLAENDLQFAYKPATPTTIQLSPEAVTLLKGLNVISTDGDKVQVEFSDIPVGDYSVLLDYIKSLEARIQTLEGGGNRTLALTKNILQEEKNDIIKEEPEELELEKGQEEEKEETTEEKTDEEPEPSAESK